MACNFTEADLCEMYYSEVETVHMRVVGMPIENSTVQMAFELLVMESKSTFEAQPIITEHTQLSRSRLHSNNSVTLWWHATRQSDDEYKGEDDATTVLRFDVPTHEGFHASDFLPPQDHYLAACSLRRWMREDTEASKSVYMRATKTSEVVGNAVVGGLSDANATFMAVVVQRGEHLASAYQVLVYNAATRMSPLFLVGVLALWQAVRRL